MPIVAADWSVTRVSGDVRYIGDAHGGASPSYGTVIELHRFLADLADDAVSVGDEELDISDETPTDRSTDNIITMLNGYNIDDLASEHLYDGSIIQDNGAIIYDGIVNFGVTPVIQVIQDGALIANPFWNNNGGLNSDAPQGISHRFLVKIRNGSVDIDGRRLVGWTRNFGNTYAEFSINGTTRGNNVFALSESNDLNNETIAATVGAWVSIVNISEGYSPIDVNGDGADEFYYSEWDLGTQSINDFYERLKWITREGSLETLYGLNGEIFRGITHEFPLTAPRSGTFNPFEPVSWPGGTGQMFAIDNAITGTVMYIQLLTGVQPGVSDLITGVTSAATITTNGSPISRPIATPFVGASTGSALIGSYGLGLEATDLTSNDKLTDLTSSVRTPPNNVTFSVSGLVIGEDRILVGPENGGNLDEVQFELGTGLTTDGITAVQISESIPTDTPSNGTIRVEDANGVYRRLHYSSYSADTFVIDTVDGNEDFAAVNAIGADNVFISYIDKLATATTESFTGVYLSDRPLFIRVRDGGGSPTKTFESPGTLGSAGGSATVIRTADD